MRDLDAADPTGIVFDEPTLPALVAAIERAAAACREPARWRRLQLNGMAVDHSWAHSAAEYRALYRSLAG